MFDKGFCLAVIAFFADLPEQPLMVIAGVEDLFIKIGMRTMILSQDIGHTGAQSDLNPFYGVKDEKAEPAVEDIEIQDILKGDSGSEMVFGISHLEG